MEHFWIIAAIAQISRRSTEEKWRRKKNYEISLYILFLRQKRFIIHSVLFFIVIPWSRKKYYCSQPFWKKLKNTNKNEMMVSYKKLFRRCVQKFILVIHPQYANIEILIFGQISKFQERSGDRICPKNTSNVHIVG